MATEMLVAGLFNKTSPATPFTRGSRYYSHTCTEFLKPTRVVSSVYLFGGNSPFSALQSASHASVSYTFSASSKSRSAIRAFADQVAMKETEGKVLMEDQAAEGKVHYNWETEWYPLYLTKEIPLDAPLALKVFDRPLVLFFDAEGKLNCLEDRCPHRLVKLSEGQIVDGKLECLYHGWQFQGDGICSKIPQLSSGAKIPRQACARSYTVKESQGVVWVWMADKSTSDVGKVPWFEHYAEDGFFDISTIHELPYDYSILLENLLDPAHIPISHNRTDPSAKREEAQTLKFEITDRSERGFAGLWSKTNNPTDVNFTRFGAPCVVTNTNSALNPKGGSQLSTFSAVLLCRPAGQGKSMAILRFGAADFLKRNRAVGLFPSWFIHINTCTILEQDMGFLSSQNEVLSRENLPTKDLYLNLRSQDTLVLEFRKWLDKVGHGMPYYWGHRTTSPAVSPALEEAAPAGLFASASISYPSKGAFASMFARDPTNRYYRHIVHCKACRVALSNFQKSQTAALAVAAFSAALAIAFSSSKTWRISLVAFAMLSCVISWACSRMVSVMTMNFFRPHRFS